MAGNIYRLMLGSAVSTFKTNCEVLRTIHTSSVSFAARKGTRAKARAKKVKVEVTKVGFIPPGPRASKGKVNQQKFNLHQDDSFKQISKDDVYPMRYYRWPVYTAAEAVIAHAETHHPTMYNQPNALVYAEVELNMEAAKKNRYMENFSRLALLPHGFPRDEERAILLFCKDPDLVSQSMDAGATLAGSTELIRRVQEGTIKLSDFDYVLAHPNILTDLVPIRGLMKRRFPSLKFGTLDNDVLGLVKKFAKGVQFKAVKDEKQPDFASIKVSVGRLNMDPKEVSENIDALLKSIQSGRPKRAGLFVTRCFVLSPPSKEKLKIDPFVHVQRTLTSEEENDSDDDEEQTAAAIA